MFHNELNKQYYLFNHSPKQSLSFDQIVIPLPEWLSKNTTLSTTDFDILTPQTYSLPFP